MEFRQAGTALLQTYSTANQSNYILVHLTILFNSTTKYNGKSEYNKHNKNNIK